MTEPAALPSDEIHRQRIATSLDETLFVEAGAGTGKTTSLVERIIGLVESGRAAIDRIAAITFTEAAAAELRERVRRRLEERVEKGECQGAARALALEAIQGMDGAYIQTLHSFAGALLRECPLEAGLAPSFEIMDEIEADVEFEERWQAWLDQALESSELGPVLAQALTLGLRIDDLRRVASAFHVDYDLLTAPFPHEPLPRRLAEPIMAAAGEIRHLSSLARNGGDDRFVSHVQRVAALAESLRDAEPDERLSLLSRCGKLSVRHGRKEDWGTDPETGVNACTRLKELLKELEEAHVQELKAVRRALFLPLLESLRLSVLEYVEERKAQGQAEFHDLLVWARDMLRDKPEVRRRFKERFAHILIDEFQDTDPIQAEIAFYLAEEPAQNALHWSLVDLAPGKLFVVGDPKQSIYRFRRADIAAVEAVRQRIGEEATVPLTHNFRSQKSVIEWVNTVFGRWMQEHAHQARYQALEARELADSLPSSVYRIGGPQAEPAGQVRRAEAQAVAALLLDIKSQHWAVREDGGSTREAGYRDVCLLLPTRTGLRTLEWALDNADVPYRVESASLLLATQDVRELLNCLRAIDAPVDQVALVAALRSSAFGCSDVELLEFVENGGRFDYLAPGPAEGPVREALEALVDYHRQRLDLSPDELIERFVRERRMIETCFDRARPRERWRRLRFVIERARAFIEIGHSSLRDFLNWMERQAEEGVRLVEMPVPETDEDAVRVMTIHASKGLEFPIVVMMGLGGAVNAKGKVALFDRATGLMQARVGSGDTAFATEGYDPAQKREKDADAAEAVRLMYVAATRARDLLVVSLFRRERDKASLAGAIESHCSETPQLWRELTPSGIRAAEEATKEDGAIGIYNDESGKTSWLARRKVVLERASHPDAFAVTSLVRVAKEEAELGNVPYRRGRGGTSLGRAVHAVLQTIDLASGSGLAEISRAQAAAEGIAHRSGEVEALARVALESSIVRRAVASGRYYRELYVSADFDGRLWEGFIDLLFDAGDGLVIVDYKTDSLGDDEGLAQARERYGLQIGAYARMVQQVTRRPVREAVLLFLQPAREEAFNDIPSLVSLAESRLAR